MSQRGFLRTAALGLGLSSLLVLVGTPAQGASVPGRVVDNTKVGTSPDPL